MNKLYAIRKKYEEAQKSMVVFQATVVELTERKEAVEADAKRLAEVGDVDGYTAKKNELALIDDKLYVTRCQIKRASNPITKEEVSDAWLQYTQTADKDLTAAWNEYKARRKKLAVSFKKLMKMQEERLDIRKQCARYISEDTRSAMTLAPKFKCFLIANRDVSHDLFFFGRNGELTRDESIRYGTATSN